ncbi:hypothetical protein V1478_001126 [Vespula squamosa]|uniref:Uncharacterized protein n=1 Tax=Vespula squamosa TaxID=30214 RepID=A0ABD2C7G4_VESSQ
MWLEFECLLNYALGRISKMAGGGGGGDGGSVVVVTMLARNAETKPERLGGGGCADASYKHGRLIARSPSPTPCSHTSELGFSSVSVTFKRLTTGESPGRIKFHNSKDLT